MKAEITAIVPNDCEPRITHRNVTVEIWKDLPNGKTLRAEFRVFVDKKHQDLKSIGDEALKHALDFVSEIPRDLHL
jgi:hypothetical protein